MVDDESAENIITWQRVRSIFGDASSPKEIWEKQFDYNDDDLKRIAATPYHEINRDDLWYYYHDLAYVELQPELFNYLFPVCLMEWHDTLMRNQSCSKGDSEFHRAVCRGNVLEKMHSSEQREQVVDFFRDSFLQRLDAEPMRSEPSFAAHAFGWICRFNSLGHISPSIERIWKPWWDAGTRGRAISVLKYCSGLIYLEGENKPFGIPCRDGSYGPSLWESDTAIVEGWLPENLAFLRGQLSFDFVVQKIKRAAGVLVDGSERDLAIAMLDDAIRNREILEARVIELPLLLSGTAASNLDGWTI